MLDMKFVRTNPELVKENIRKKFQEEKLKLVDEVIELDQQFRDAKSRGDFLRSQRNTISKQIGGLMAQGKKEEAEAAKAAALVREGKADLLMKGKLDTAVLLKAVVNKEHGLGKGGVMSHFSIFEVPGYHKLLCPVDGGMMTYPTLEQKKAIIENTVGVLHAMGYECPKVGVLACVEKVNPKMPETVEADALKQMNQRGEITGCIVEGPVSYDCAMSKEIAEFKGFDSPVSGDCDVLVAPNIHAGNIMGKLLTVTCGARLAGMMVGAKCPIVMTSRGSSAEEKYLSIVLAAAAAQKEA